MQGGAEYTQFCHLISSKPASECTALLPPNKLGICRLLLRSRNSIIPSEGASGVAQMFTEVLLTGSERVAGDSTTIPTSDFKNGVDGGATHLPSWQLLERTTALGDDERDVIELGAGGELLDLFHNRSD